MISSAIQQTRRPGRRSWTRVRESRSAAWPPPRTPGSSSTRRARPSPISTGTHNLKVGWDWAAQIKPDDYMTFSTAGHPRAMRYDRRVTQRLSRGGCQLPDHQRRAEPGHVLHHALARSANDESGRRLRAGPDLVEQVDHQRRSAVRLPQLELPGLRCRAQAVCAGCASTSRVPTS